MLRLHVINIRSFHCSLILQYIHSSLSKTHVATGTQAYLKTMIIINIEQTNTQNNYKFMVLKTCINTTQIPNTDKTYKLQCADAILKVHFN